MAMPDRKFDWRPSTDPRNEQYLSRPLLATMIPRKAKAWQGPYWRIDQGPDGACVGFGWTNEAMSKPIVFRPSPYTKAEAEAFAFDRYHQAQRLDEWAGEDYEGSSVNGGAKAMRAQGYITGWRWHRTVDDIIDALITDGPQVLGSDWLTGMFNTDGHGLVKVAGSVAGGHCYCATGYYPRWYGVEAVRCRQSWGPHWGINGDFYLPVDGLRSLWSDGAEAAMPIGRSYGPT